MTIRVQFFSQLKDVVRASELELELAEGTTAGQLLSELCDRYPRLRAWDRRLLFGAGVEFVNRDYVIKPGDEIAIMPPVQGG